MILESLYSQLDLLSSDSKELRSIHSRIGRPGDLSFVQAIALYSICLKLRPNVIVDLGRAYGNSAAVFTAAAHRVRNCEVHSFCMTEVWQQETVPRLGQPEEWFSPLRLHTGDLTQVDFSPILKSSDRTLVFLDAHGMAVAEHLLGHIMPIIADRVHLVVCHDICDNRFNAGYAGSYQGAALLAKDG